jgi:deoxyribodipyrimidine photo-lyase
MTIVWFRQDLRLADNPALQAAMQRGPVVPVFIWDEGGEGRWAPGSASRWWLHHSLQALDEALRRRGSRLVLRRGDAAACLKRLVAEMGADAVYWNRRHEPSVRRRDREVESELGIAGRETRPFEASLLFAPDDLRNQTGGPFQVFTPFWKRCLAVAAARPPRAPLPALERIPAPARWPVTEPLDALQLLPKIPWDAGLRLAWTPGETAAAARLRHFVSAALGNYADDRDRPDLDGTSSLSAALHFGEISPHQVWAAVRAAPPGHGADVFLKEIGWREFAYHLLAHFPATPEAPLRPAYAAFPWRKDAGHLEAWQRGRTGYPLIDAGMRQLWRTGWMHNRVRMIVASFLVKDLRISWRAGADWFWDTLVDADLASNTLGWQWAAGCGADAAPYFRIFHPVLQARRFDPDGAYVRRWVPELAKLPTPHLHAPWEAPGELLAAAGVRLGATYPVPLVDHAQARSAALAAFRTLRDAQPAAGKQNPGFFKTCA